MAQDSFKVKNSINILPSSAQGSSPAAGDLRVDSADSNKLKYNDGTSEAEIPTATSTTTLTNKTLTSPVISSPTGLTKSDVGLGNVDNTSDVTKNAAAVALTNKTIDASLNTISNISNTEIKTGAAIALNKLAATTASKALVSDASGVISASAVTSTELGYVSGVSSAIQTQLNNKQATITGAATSIASSNLTASKALVSDASGKVAASAVTDTELGYLSGVTSSIQTQISGKQATITGGATSITSSNLTASKALVSDASGKVAASAVTDTELGYVSGVSSAIQTQLNGKQATITGAASSVVSSNLSINQAVITDASGKLTSESALAITRGGTGQTTKSAAFDALSPMTTSGDIIYGGASGTGTRLAKGVDGQVLTLSSGLPSWQTSTGLLQVASKTTTYTATTADDVILCSTAGGAWTLSLFTAVGNTGKRLYIKKTTSDTNALTIDPNSTETLDGLLTRKLVGQYDEMIIVSDGTNWQVLSSTETIAAEYTNLSTTQTGINTNNTAVKINYADKVLDTHNAFSSGTFTAPAPKKYLVSGTISIVGTNVLNNRYFAMVKKNGTEVFRGNEFTPAAGAYFGTTFSGIVYCSATTDTIEVYLYGVGNNSASTLTASGGALSIISVGN